MKFQEEIQLTKIDILKEFINRKKRKKKIDSKKKLNKKKKLNFCYFFFLLYL